MPPSRTPAHAPLRHNARPQFASTPRFLLSRRSVGQHRQDENSDSVASEDDADPYHFVANRTAPRGPTRRKDVIEDISREPGQEHGVHQQPIGETQATDIPSSPPVDSAELDAEIDELFGPTGSRAKRRRISVDLTTPRIQMQTRKSRDFIQSSSPEPPFPAPEPPSPSLPYRTTPVTPRRPATPTTAKPSTRSFPRFLVPSSAHPPPNTQSQRARPLPKTLGPAARKPTFVLPRSPSPEHEGPDGVPTPFSPSSHALRRKGRQRSSAPHYLPGGMAAEVRSWILEMGTKREQQVPAVRDNRNGGNSLLVNLPKYSLVFRVSSVRQTALGSCGPLAFIRCQDEQLSLEQGGLENGEDTLLKFRNVLLIGAPRPRAGRRQPLAPTRVPKLRKGDVLGVHRGLVWEIGVGSNTALVPEQEKILQRESQRAPELGKWHIGMEWDIISSMS